MRKKQLLLHLMLFQASSLLAQTGKQQDNVTLKAYTTHVTTNSNQAYGDEIYKGGKLKVKRTAGTCFSVLSRFNRKENPLIVVKWQVNQLQQGEADNTFLPVEEV